MSRPHGLRVAATAGGLAAALLLGSGLVAVGTDAVTSPGNAVASPTLPATADLQVGTVGAAPSGAPACGAWSDDTTIPMRFGPGGADAVGTLGDATLVSATTFCLRNAGSVPLRVHVAFAEVVSTDLGCGPGEADRDAGCAEGDPGELDGSDPTIAPGETDDQVEVWQDPANRLDRRVDGFPCLVAEAACDAGDQTRGSLGTLAPSEVRTLTLGFDWAGDRVVSQSDLLEWDIVFTGQG